MHKFLKSVIDNAGFTMIELLIVISILGILAVAVLSAINPIEQINRGRDTGSRSDAEQFLSAIDRFHAFQGYYPWTDGAGDLTIALNWGLVNNSNALISDSNGCSMIDKLGQPRNPGPDCVGSDELKNTFFNRITAATYNPLYVYNRGTQGDSTYVCFAPKSKAFVTEAAARVSAGLPDDYPAAATEAVANTTDCGSGGNCICLP